MEYCEIERETLEIPDVPGDSLLALGRSVHRTSVEPQLGRDGLSEGSVIPIGRSGELRWNNLESRLAMLVSPPWRDAVLIVQRSRLDGISEIDEIWKRFVSDAESSKVIVLESVASEAEPGSFPSLTPSDSGLAPWLSQAITDYRPESVSSKTELTALTAGLFQVQGQLDESHSYSQSIEGQGRNHAGDYWHAIMHRREPDYGNSKYWFRKVGNHPIFSTLCSEAETVFEHLADSEAKKWGERLCENGWDPFAFVDLCQEVAHEQETVLGIAARHLQWIEMLLLLDQTYDDATA